MGLIITLGIQELVVVLTSLMLVSAGALALAYKLLRPKYPPRGGESSNPYLSGEGEDVVTSVHAPSTALYWGFVKGWGARLYGYLRETLHNGNLSDWSSYMSLWLSAGLIISALATVAYLVWGG